MNSTAGALIRVYAADIYYEICKGISAKYPWHLGQNLVNFLLPCVTTFQKIQEAKAKCIPKEIQQTDQSFNKKKVHLIKKSQPF